MQRGSEEKSDFIFTTLGGEAMLDPRPGIDTNPHHKIDYQAFHPATKTAIAERWGLRPTQEDRVVVEQLPDFIFLSLADRERVLDQTVRALQAEINTQHQAVYEGSTLCVTVLCGKTLYNANVGDSESFLVVRDETDAVIRFERINAVLHEINDENVASLKEAGFKIKSSLNDGHRLVDADGLPGINMYRAIGDLAYDSAGLQHHPDLYKVHVDIPQGGNAYVINACDGLTEVLSFAELEKIIKKNSHALLKDMPLILANAALAHGSHDNISVMVTPVDLSEKVKYLAIFDGHGGSLVSDFLSESFHKMLVQKSRE
jgi:serine/threonine protein phosphatase PrpC